MADENAAETWPPVTITILFYLSHGGRWRMAQPIACSHVQYWQPCYAVSEGGSSVAFRGLKVDRG